MKIRRSLIPILLLAFLVNVLLPFFATYSWPQAGNAVAAESSVSTVFGEKILICSEGGFKWVSLADLQNGAEKPHPEYKCPLCYVAAHGIKHTGPASAAAIAETPFIAQRHYYPAVRLAWSYRLFKTPYSRAPPAAIIA